MKRLLLLVAACLAPLLSAYAGGIKWGQPVNGLRVGLESAVTTMTADQELKFTVTVQNVANQPITIPTLDTYLLDTTRSDDFHTTLLAPFITRDRSLSWPGVYESFMSSAIGPDATSLQEHVVTIPAGQSVTWNEVPLGRGFYSGEHPEPNGKTNIQKNTLEPGGHYHIEFRMVNNEPVVAKTKVWTGETETGAVDLQVTAARTDGISVEGGFSLPKTTYFVGEPMEATFTVTNKGPKPIFFETGGDGDAAGRHGRFSISAVDSWGLWVSDPAGWKNFFGGVGGGLGGMENLAPGGSYTEQVLVNQWCAFGKAGKYWVTCKRTLNVNTDPPGPTDLRAESTLPAIPIKTTLEVTLDDNAAALTSYIAGLAPAILKKDQASAAACDQLKSLAQAKNADAFPEVVKLLDAPAPYPLMATEWLVPYGGDKAGPVLLERWPRLEEQAKGFALRQLAVIWNVRGADALMATALRDPEPQVREEAVMDCWMRPSASCTPILLGMGHDPDPLVRRYLGQALGACGDEKAIPVLLELLNDSSNSFIQIWAAEGLGKFKRMDGVPVMIALLRDPRLRDDEGNVMETLKHLTGEDFNSNRDRYLAWWEKTGKAKYGK